MVYWLGSTILAGLTGSNSAPNDFNNCNFSKDVSSGKQIWQIYPKALHNIANDIPVDPLVPSNIILFALGINWPDDSAARIIANATRSFALPPGLQSSNLAYILQPNWRDNDFISIKGVLPINDSMPRVRGGNNVSLEFDLSLLVVVTYKLYNSLAIRNNDITDAEVCNVDFQLIAILIN